MLKILLTFFFLISFSTHAMEQQSLESIGAQIRFKVIKYQLDNGLTVLLHEDHQVPLISFHSWFKVGSKYEEPGYTGIAHLFEHLMFHGTKRFSGEKFERLLQSNGAINNAFTSEDFTGYYVNFPSDKLELILDTESDRIQNLIINEESVTKEREVVKEERRYRVDNNISGQVRELIQKTAFRVHPYKWPVIGYMKDLDNINIEKCLSFYKTFYAPNNAVVVIAGDINIDKTKKMIEKYYGKIPRQELPKLTIPEEPIQNAVRSIMVYKHVQNPTIDVVFVTPPAGHDDVYALDLAANILGDGQSSWLHRRLVYHQQVATTIFSYNLSSQDSGLFRVSATLHPDASIENTKKMMFGEIWKLRIHDISNDELEKAKNQVIRNYVESLKTLDGKAKTMALNEILLGSYDYFFKDIQKYSAVKKEDIKRVAIKYLIPEKRSIVVVQPESRRVSSHMSKE